MVLHSFSRALIGIRLPWFLGVLALIPLATGNVCGQVTPFAPRVLTSTYGYPLNGGRVHAIAVHPRNSLHIVVSAEFGGLWKTENGGSTWFHLDALTTVFTRDVAYSPDGGTLVATLDRDAYVANGGGIWLSRDGGYSWTRPTSGTPPASSRAPSRGSAYGISFAPDDPSRMYVGTDYGIAVSHDNGATWTHAMIDAASPVRTDSLQGSGMSVVALSRDRVVTVTRQSVHRSDDGGRTWRRLRDGGSFYNGFKNADRSPLDADQVFIIQDYSTLLQYDAQTQAWTTLPLPGGISRGPFVRVARDGTPTGVDVWVGVGARLVRARCPDMRCVRNLRAVDWTGVVEGLHSDAGDLGLDGSGRPVLYGSDGGVFRPVRADLSAWTSAAAPGSGFNSYQITDLAGTNVPGPNGYRASLYFATQDNGIWASADDGLTWPFSDCAEGFHMEVEKDAARDEDVTVAYGRIGCPSGVMMSDAHLQRRREISNLDVNGVPVDGMAEAFLISPGWIRLRVRKDSSPELWVSDDNGARWRRRAIVGLEGAGVFQASSRRQVRSVFAHAIHRPVVYAPFKGLQRDARGRPRIGLIRLDDPLAASERRLGDANLLYLPDGGSLGMRATMFDWQTVFGVDPRNASYIIAPDVVNQVVKVSRNGGRDWETDDDLTHEVTRGGSALLYDDHPYRMQVTHIAFDPYDEKRILVGTRDAGVVVTTNGGFNWFTVPKSDVIRYITGFFFRRDGSVVVSSYGMGLWNLEIRDRRAPFPLEELCRPPCGMRGVRWDRRFVFERQLQDVFVVFRGRISAVERDGERVTAIRVTPGSRWARYTPQGVDRPPIAVLEDTDISGIRTLARQLRVSRSTWVTGLVLEEGRMRASLTSPRALVREDAMPFGAPGLWQWDGAREPTYLFVTTTLPGSGLPVVGEDGLLHLRALGFARDSGGVAEVLVEIDGTAVQPDSVAASDRGLMLTARVPANLPPGEHRVRVLQRGGGINHEAAATFVTAVFDQFERQPLPPS